MHTDFSSLSVLLQFQQTLIFHSQEYLLLNTQMLTLNAGNYM
jgi:hypothetical protein